jgi:hypothetical protein
MVERIRKEFAKLRAPDCDVCHSKMEWYSSQRLLTAPDQIAHYFSCPKCGSVKQIMKKARNGNGNGHESGMDAQPRPAEIIILADYRAA